MMTSHESIEKSLAEIDFASLCDRKFFPSPETWEDLVLYFLMLDRFSDNQEKDYLDLQGQKVSTGKTPKFNPQTDANTANPEDWQKAGTKWLGGNLKGLTRKIGYLKRLGISAIWVSPIFKQVAFQDSYHGYGIQNFLDVDPHFGTREDLRELVQVAHKHGIYVILDIILNHAGDVFRYEANHAYWTGEEYAVKGFHDQQGEPTLPFSQIDLNTHPDAWPNGAIWPKEFQDPDIFTRKGYIKDWDYDPEFVEGDFLSLKDIKLGQGNMDHYQPSPALRYLCQVYKFWIAYADIDGFRVDTVKHMDKGATRFFSSVIHEFAQAIGKERFYLIGEITGGRRRAFETLEETGMDAALGIDDIPDKLEYLVKGYREPRDYFSLFRNSLLVQKESHIWFRDKVVTMYDDHDQVRKGNYKARFCADKDADKVALNALALNATTLGIPCVYYGSEQCFNGSGDSDRYLRETMFGGEFGSFRSQNRHFFDEDNWVYQEFAQILRIRTERIELRRGRQFLRSVSGDGINFGIPHLVGDEIRFIVPWSRIFNDREILLAINTDYSNSHSAWVTIDQDLHQEGEVLTCIYSTDKAQENQSAKIEARNGKSAFITVPPAGFVMYLNSSK